MGTRILGLGYQATGFGTPTAGLGFWGPGNYVPDPGPDPDLSRVGFAQRFRPIIWNLACVQLHLGQKPVIVAWQPA